MPEPRTSAFACIAVGPVARISFFISSLLYVVLAERSTVLFSNLNGEHFEDWLNIVLGWSGLILELEQVDPSHWHWDMSLEYIPAPAIKAVLFWKITVVFYVGKTLEKQRKHITFLHNNLNFLCFWKVY